VPINPSRMRHPRDDAVVVSLAGPATNVLLAIIAGVVLRLQHPAFLALGSGPLRLRIPLAFGIINVVLAVFNLIPIPPLDGSAVVDRFIPKAWRNGWEALRRYGFLILLGLVLLLPGSLSRLFNPAINLWVRIISP
jgi:Zn-dependent protease